MNKPIFILNGPNLNMLGLREPAVYGTDTLDDVRAKAQARAGTLGLSIDFRQSNHEGEIIGWIQEARDKAICIGAFNIPVGYRIKQTLARNFTGAFILHGDT